MRRGDALGNSPIEAMLDKDSGYRARCRYAGLKRAAYWRALGHPNLVLARIASQATYAARRRAKELAAQADDAIPPPPE